MDLSGIFRGKVYDSDDPLRRGRIKALVPAISDHELTWALPCFPFNGSSKPDQYAVPPAGTNVWIEFEQGDYDRPIWVGIFF